MHSQGSLKSSSDSKYAFYASIYLDFHNYNLMTFKNIENLELCLATKTI